MAISTGQYTIVDYNDALTLTGYIGSNQPKAQQFNPDNGSYAPNWETTNLILTPSLYKLGSAADIITDAAVTSVKWYDVAGGVPTLISNNSTYAIAASGAKALTVKANTLAGISAKEYVCEITYHDASTNLDLTFKSSVSFARVVNGGGIADAVCWCPNGNVFKNGGVASLKAHVDLWRGSVIDTTLVTYEWYQQDSSIATDQGGGIGWKKLTDVAGRVTGTATNEITIYADQVLSYGVFKAKVKDTDSASNTYNSSFYDTVTIADQSDPFQVSIMSTGGDTFKNGIGQTTLTARLFQAGTEVDPSNGTPNTGYKYAYVWTVYDKDGNLSTFYGGAASKTAKYISVGDLDVTTKATFNVTISKIE